MAMKNNNTSVELDGLVWLKGPVLGQGSSATVYLATSPYLPPIAVKTSILSNSCNLPHERHLMEIFRGCPELLQCYGHNITMEKGGVETYSLLLEYAPGGTLEHLIINSGGRIQKEEQVRRYTRMILKGISQMHDRGYVHGDIKPWNILVFPSEDEDHINLKIADFGLSKKMGTHVPSKKRNLHNYWGTPSYASPESVVDGYHEAPMDIWALGCVVMQMVLGSLPWDFMDLDDMLSFIATTKKAPEVPHGFMSQIGRDFVSKCFEIDLLKRPTAERLLKHPFIVGQPKLSSKSNCCCKCGANSRKI